ncbi:hypothetical protein PRUPE_4G235500, partial [Prunus persica]
NKKTTLPPGPRGFPIFGSLHLLAEFPNKDIHRLAQKYGDIMYMRLGLIPTIVISSPKGAELFLKTHDLAFASSPPHEGAKHISFGQRNLSFAEYGPYWRDIRKMCTLEWLSNHKNNSFKSMRREEVAVCVEAIRAAANSGSIAVDLSDNASSLSVYMSCRMVFGKKYMDVEFDGRGFMSVRMKSVNKAFDTFFEKVIEQHLQYNDGERTKNFVDVMMGFMGSEKSKYRIKRPHIKAIILDMLAASIDPSSTAVEWAFSELMRHPKAMKKVQKELENVVGLDRMVEESDLLHCQWHHIPKKSHVIINAWAIGRDPSAWTDAEEFIPERFEGSNIDTLPWMHLGLTVVQIVLAQLVHCFDWELPDSMLPEEDMTEVFGLTISRAKHLLAIPFYRLHK